MLNEKITELRSQINEAKKVIADQAAEAIKKANADAVEEAITLKAEVDKRKEELTAMEEKLAAMQSVAELESTQTETKAKKDDEEEKPESDEAEEEAPKEVAEEATEESESKEDEDEEDKKKEEKRQLNLNEKDDVKMVKEIITVQGTENKEMELRSALGEYVKTKGRNVAELEERGLVSTDAGVLIPEDIVYTPKAFPETVANLRSHVNVVSVKNPQGSYPVLAQENEVLVTKLELEANPSLANPKFTEVDYKVETYAGEIRLSAEAIDDTAINLSNLVVQSIRRKVLNTTNKKIAAIMKTFDAKSVATIADIKTILNVDIDPVYNVKLFLSQSAFNHLDQMLDGNGRGLLQPDATAASNYKILGREVVILKDDMIGAAAGDKVAFIGDAQAGISMFNRKEVEVAYDLPDLYGKALGVAFRADFKKVDDAAGFYVTFA